MDGAEAEVARRRLLGRPRALFPLSVRLPRSTLPLGRVAKQDTKKASSLGSQESHGCFSTTICPMPHVPCLFLSSSIFTGPSLPTLLFHLSHFRLAQTWIRLRLTLPSSARAGTWTKESINNVEKSMTQNGTAIHKRATKWCTIVCKPDEWVAVTLDGGRREPSGKLRPTPRPQSQRSL